jgi:hypothetical protein
MTGKSWIPIALAWVIGGTAVASGLAAVVFLAACSMRVSPHDFPAFKLTPPTDSVMSKPKSQVTAPGGVRSSGESPPQETAH